MGHLKSKRNKTPRIRLTKKHQFLSLLSLGALLALGTTPAEALPGQKTETVIAWINSNPTLQPTAGEGLIVKRSDTPAHRFEFRASVVPPGRISTTYNPGIVRTERYFVYDSINGVPPERLVESLRILYGLDIYEDYQLARVVYAYPSRETEELSRRHNQRAIPADRGELREGKRFAYWMEVTYREDGKPISGKITVFLKEDLEKLNVELRDR